MGLLKSFNNGTQTDLTQKRFGNDRPGRGSSNQPYIQASVERSVAPGFNSDAIVRGGMSAATTALEDSTRLADVLFDNNSPVGFLFVEKQRLLSKISPKTPASFGSGYQGGSLNQGVYSPLTTVEQAKRGFSGFHAERFGLFLGVGLNRYVDVVQGKTTNGVPSDSRVFGLQQALFTENGAPEGTLKPFKVSNDNDTPIIMQYSGGPGSLSGRENTLLKYSTSPQGGKSSININTEGTYFKTSFDLEQPNFTTAFDLTDKVAGEGLQIINNSRYELQDTFNIESVFNLRGNGTNKWGLGTNVNPKAATTVVGGILSTNIKLENTLFTPIPSPTEDNQYNRPRDISNKTSTISSVESLYSQFFVNSQQIPTLKKFPGPEGDDRFGISNTLINKSTTQTASPINSNIRLRGTIFEAPFRILNRTFTTALNLTSKTSYNSLDTLWNDKILPGQSYTNLYNPPGNSSEDWGLGEGVSINLATGPDGAPITTNLLKLSAGGYFLNPSDIPQAINSAIRKTSSDVDNREFSILRLFNESGTSDGIILNYTINKNGSSKFGFRSNNNILVAKDNNNAPIILPDSNTNTIPFATQLNVGNQISVTGKIESAYNSIQNNGGETAAELNNNPLATDNNNSPLGARTVNSKFTEQLTLDQINTKASLPATQDNYPSGVPNIEDDFRNETERYSLYASVYNPRTNKDGRTQHGSPGGLDSKVVNRNNIRSPFASFSGLSRADVLDKINASKIYKSEQASTGLNDLVNFRIGIIDNDNPREKDYIHFRAFLKDIDDQYESSWDPIEYVGRSEKFYNYKGGFERTINTSWIVAAQSKGELLPMYQKLNFLASTLAGDYSAAGYNRGNLSTLTIGDYVVEQPGFFKSISYKMKQGNPWELGINESGTLEGPQLCHIIEVSNFSFTCIHDFRPQKLQDQFDSSRSFILNNPDKQYISSNFSPV